jgi:prepilin-type N-terminal cleavage/methylation domain-containing protein
VVTDRARTGTSRVRDERGFSLVELLIAAAISALVLGATAALAARMQQSYGTDLDDVAVEEEVRFALDWIARLLRAAGSNPYAITVSPCPAAGTAFQALRLDPDGDGIQDDVRIQADINPPNGILVGSAGACTTEPGEDVTIAHDAGAFVITRQDNGVDGTPRAMTDPIVTQLRFTYLDTARAATTDPAVIAYAQVSITGRARAWNAERQQFNTKTLQTEVRLRLR